MLKETCWCNDAVQERSPEISALKEPEDEPENNSNEYGDTIENRSFVWNNEDTDITDDIQIDDRQVCRSCGRKFNPISFERHKRVCHQVFRSIRPTFDSMRGSMVASTDGERRHGISWNQPKTPCFQFQRSQMTPRGDIATKLTTFSPKPAEPQFQLVGHFGQQSPTCSSAPESPLPSRCTTPNTRTVIGLHTKMDLAEKAMERRERQVLERLERQMQELRRMKQECNYSVQTEKHWFDPRTKCKPDEIVADEIIDRFLSTVVEATTRNNTIYQEHDAVNTHDPLSAQPLPIEMRLRQPSHDQEVQPQDSKTTFETPDITGVLQLSMMSQGSHEVSPCRSSRTCFSTRHARKSATRVTATSPVRLSSPAEEQTDQDVSPPRRRATISTIPHQPDVLLQRRRHSPPSPPRHHGQDTSPKPARVIRPATAHPCSSSVRPACIRASVEYSEGDRARNPSHRGTSHFRESADGITSGVAPISTAFPAPSQLCRLCPNCGRCLQPQTFEQHLRRCRMTAPQPLARLTAPVPSQNNSHKDTPRRASADTPGRRRLKTKPSAQPGTATEATTAGPMAPKSQDTEPRCSDSTPTASLPVAVHPELHEFCKERAGMLERARLSLKVARSRGASSTMRSCSTEDLASAYDAVQNLAQITKLTNKVLPVHEKVLARAYSPQESHHMRDRARRLTCELGTPRQKASPGRRTVLGSSCAPRGSSVPAPRFQAG